VREAAGSDPTSQVEHERRALVERPVRRVGGMRTGRVDEVAPAHRDLVPDRVVAEPRDSPGRFPGETRREVGEPLGDAAGGVGTRGLGLERGGETGQSEPAEPVGRARQLGLEPVRPGAFGVHDDAV